MKKVRIIYEFEFDESNVDRKCVDVDGLAIDSAVREMTDLIENGELFASDFTYKIETEKMLAKEKEGELFKQDLPVCLLKESWNEGLKQQTEIILVLMDGQECEYKYPYPVVAVDIVSGDGDRTAIFKTSEPISDTFVAKISTTFHGIDLEMEIAEELNIKWVESIFYEDGSIITPEMVEKTTMQRKGEKYGESDI